MLRDVAKGRKSEDRRDEAEVIRRQLGDCRIPRRRKNVLYARLQELETADEVGERSV